MDRVLCDLMELPYQVSRNLSGTVSVTVSVTVAGLPHGSAENGLSGITE